MNNLIVSLRSITVLVSLFCIAVPAQAEAFRFIGDAFDPTGQTLLYTETHEVDLDEAGEYRRASVSYDGPNGQPIAFKKLDYSVERLRPELDFIDFRTAQQVIVQHSGRAMLLQTKTMSDLQQVNIPVEEEPKLTVVDAGFDQLVGRYWEQLKAGEDIEFEVLALSRASLISFRVYRTSLSEQHVELAIAPANWLIRLLMDPIALKYDRQTGRLLEYQGVTNIQASVDGEVSEDNFTAWIKYRYFDSSDDDNAADLVAKKNLTIVSLPAAELTVP